MRSFFRSTSLIAIFVGTLVIGIGSAATYERSDSFVLAKSDRLPSAGNLGGQSVTAETRLRGVSVLCRLPIEIGVLNTPLSARCNWSV